MELNNFYQISAAVIMLVFWSYVVYKLKEVNKPGGDIKKA